MDIRRTKSRHSLKDSGTVEPCKKSRFWAALGPFEILVRLGLAYIVVALATKAGNKIAYEENWDIIPSMDYHALNPDPNVLYSEVIPMGIWLASLSLATYLILGFFSYFRRR